MKVLLLFDVGRPFSPDEFGPDRDLKEDQPTEADVFGALLRLGHEVEKMPVFDDIMPLLERVKSFAPDVVFNLVEAVHSDRSYEPNIPALLSLLKVRFTGAGPEALLLSKDKALSKKILTYHRVRVPHFRISELARPLRRLRRFQFPGIVKPIGEDGSDGISKASFVRNEGEAIERARFVHEKFRCDVVIEEYVEGRELYLSVLGHYRPTVFPPRELFFEEVPDGEPKIATYKTKWDPAYRERWGIYCDPAAELAPGIEKKLVMAARIVYRALKIRGFGRIDVRLTPDGEVVVIEANPNPSLAGEEDFAQSAEAAGIEYDALIQKVLDAAME